MKISIISDIHDNLVNLNKCLDWCNGEGVEKIICCGDVTNSETLEVLSLRFPKDIYLVRGNMEIYAEEEIKKYKNFHYQGRTACFEIEDKNVGVCHEPFYIEQILKKKKCDIVFYGHTHRPWQETKDSVMRINPGTLGGVFQRASFAVWDVGNRGLELKLLEKI